MKFKKGHTPWIKGKHIQTNDSLINWIKKHGAWNKGKKIPEFQGEKSPHWKGGRPKCIDCGKQLARYKAIRCNKCANKIITSSSKFRQLNSAKLKGSNNPNWKGGISSLVEIIRDLPEYRKWREEIFERDNYTCQECFLTGGNLHIHHIKFFTTVLKEFLQEYPQFSPIDDKEILVRLTISYKPFWDINNGKTLCVKCHRKTMTPEVKKAREEVINATKIK